MDFSGKVSMKKIGFDNEKYLKEQTSCILERVKQFDNKLYLEFGGKIVFDYHASRVLPGFDPNVKIKLLQQLKDNADLILCIYAGDIERRKIRADFGITYDVDALKLIDDLRDWGVTVTAVVITRFENQPSARIFKNKLERRGMKVYTHKFTKGYPTDVDMIVSDEGYGANEYIETTKPLVVVTGPGPGSGKLATCLSQLYHDSKKGESSGYAKFETFPIWNMPLKHPVNVAYEAATADLKDFNMIDSFYLDVYGEKAVNYNRDMEIFPVINRILQKICGKEIAYKSPTDMGVNRAGFGVIDDGAVQEASEQEIIRRYFRCSCEHAIGFGDKDSIQRVELLMKDLGINPEDRTVVKFSREAAAKAEKSGKGNEGTFCGAAIELNDGKIITGRNSEIMHAASSVIINAIKHLAGIEDKVHLLSPEIMHSIGSLKEKILNKHSVSLDLEETLIALSICAAIDPKTKLAVEKLQELKKCEVHLTHMPASGDEDGFRSLGVNLTSDPKFSSRRLYLS